MRQTLAVGFAAAAILLAASTAAAERVGQIGSWTVRADHFENGAPYCYTGAERGAGDRLTFVRSELGLAAILTRGSWDLAEAAVEVDVAVDDRWRDRQRAAADGRTLILTWAEPAPARTALARGFELRVTGRASGRGVTWSLAGSGRALAAIERCWRDRQTAFGRGRAPERDPFRADAAPTAEPRDAAVDRHALAAEFETWLDLAAASYRVTVAPVAGDPARFELETILGAGRLQLLAGATPAAVLARGTAALRAKCSARAATADHGRHSLNGITVLRTGLVCGEPKQHSEAVVVSWPHGPGGLLLIVPDPGGRGLGADFTAAVVESLAEREGLELRLRAGALSS